MSRMYRAEVPAYGTLSRLVDKVNAEVLSESSETALPDADRQRLSAERHGAIRVGTGAELALIRRVFAVMAMHPVGYYDLSVAGLPVHSTAFRPITSDALAANPFRIFCSLLRLDLIADARLREEAAALLAERRIFSAPALELLELAERRGGLGDSDAQTFVAEVVKTFRWQQRARVSLSTYQRLKRSHPLIADIVAFAGPHINHLTPRTLDIDRVQALMPEYGMQPKQEIEGPPRRRHPILLRQTAFRALEEMVDFIDADGTTQPGSHTARFGEVEQRGAALTTAGRALFDRLLSEALEGRRRFDDAFIDFPDDWDAMRRSGLVYARFRRNKSGKIAEEPITYEDFLPVSAAGIFRSNLNQSEGAAASACGAQSDFEALLGCKTIDPFDLYRQIEQQSLQEAQQKLPDDQNR